MHIVIHSSDGCSGRFHFLIVADSAAVSTGVPAFLRSIPFKSGNGRVSLTGPHRGVNEPTEAPELPSWASAPARPSLPAPGQGAPPAVQTPPRPRWVFPGNSHQLIYHQSDADQVLGSLPSRETD